MLDGLIYLAHPIRADESFTFDQNVEHVGKLCRKLNLASIPAAAPYLSMFGYFDDANESERALGFVMNRRFMSGCSALLATGHKWSTGMRAEYKMAYELNLPIINCVGHDSNSIIEAVSRYHYGIAMLTD